MNFTELQARIEADQLKLRELIAAERSSAFAEIQKIIETHKLTLGDFREAGIFPKSKAGRQPGQTKEVLAQLRAEKEAAKVSTPIGDATETAATAEECQIPPPLPSKQKRAKAAA